MQKVDALNLADTSIYLPKVPSMLSLRCCGSELFVAVVRDQTQTASHATYSIHRPLHPCLYLRIHHLSTPAYPGAGTPLDSSFFTSAFGFDFTFFLCSVFVSLWPRHVGYKRARVACCPSNTAARISTTSDSTRPRQQLIVTYAWRQHLSSHRHAQCPPWLTEDCLWPTIPMPPTHPSEMLLP